MTSRFKLWIVLLAVLSVVTAAHAEVQMCRVFSDHMVLQRGRPIPVFGIADPGEKVSVTFSGTTVSATADSQGNWKVLLPTRPANTKAQQMTVKGTNTLAFEDVLVGDVWLCSGQSNMDMGLGGCNRKEDIDSANFPGIRSFRTPLVAAGTPEKMVKGNVGWNVCTPAAAGGFSATAFYFGRKVYKDTNGAIPIGLLTASVGGTSIDLWLNPEGVIDIKDIQPILSQPVLPGGPFHLFNGMIAPLAPYGIKGVLWYQGENAERTVQTPNSYYLKLKALINGWKRLWGTDDLAFYYVMIANWGELPKGPAPELISGGWNADTRLQEAMAMALPHSGCASAIDIGDSSMGDKVWDGWHPKDKLEVGERLALWALKNDYGKPKTVASGPTLKTVALSGSTIVCTFDNIGSGLVTGTKAWYTPVTETPGVSVNRTSIAGADGKWYPATAVIKGSTVVVSSPSVPEPRKVAYACWQNPEGCNLFNKEGLPAAPFYVDDVTKSYTITAKAGPGGEISPAGASKMVERMTALYTIKPKQGYFISDVKVDGASVGSVPYYTFDPIYASHNIEATFSKKAPTYTVTISANSGGTITPSGVASIPQGGAKSFTILPDKGNIVKTLTVDGLSVGPRENVTFTDVRMDHKIVASFACMVNSEAGFGGYVSPSGEQMVDYAGKQTCEIKPISGYSIDSVVVDGRNVGPVDSYVFENVKTSHTLTATFKPAAAREGSIPQKDQLILAALADSLPEKTGVWPTLVPEGDKLTPTSSPVPVKIAGKPFSRNLYLDGDGYSFKTYNAGIPCNGASIVVAARPIKSAAGSGWFSIVDVFYDRLTIGIRADSGLICVRRNGPIDNSEKPIPDGQITILSLIVQPDGQYKVYANGEEVMASTDKSDMTQIALPEAGFAHSITVGRNAPDAWTTFNGDIGDVFLYKVALSDQERQDLEAYIAKRLSTK